MPKLIVKPEEGDEIVHELTGPVVLGREEGDIVVPDRKLSRKHFRVQRETTGWMFEDLGSSNGSRVNGVARKRHALKNGDKIQVGHTVVRYEADAPKQYGQLKRTSARDRLGARKKGS